MAIIYLYPSPPFRHQMAGFSSLWVVRPRVLCCHLLKRSLQGCLCYGSSTLYSVVLLIWNIIFLLLSAVNFTVSCNWIILWISFYFLPDFRPNSVVSEVCCTILTKRLTFLWRQSKVCNSILKYLTVLESKMNGLLSFLFSVVRSSGYTMILDASSLRL